MKTPNFVHLNVHSHYSILNGCSTIQQIVDSAIKNKMPGIAITDYGNMFGIMEFIEYVARINKERQEKGKKQFKPIIGCELYVAKHGSKEQKNGVKDIKGYHLTVLAKNLIGYKNLIKIVSNAWTDGFYAAPRTDRKDLESYHEGLIILSGGFGSEVFTHIYKEDIAAMITREEKKLAEENMERLGISGLSRRCYRELSGGQQQRVLLARALCATRKLLLLDEPVSGLDPKVTAEMYDIIKKLNNDGITIIMISHDIAAAVRFASHILHIGESVFFGTRDEYLSSEKGKIFLSAEGGASE